MRSWQALRTSVGRWIWVLAGFSIPRYLGKLLLEIWRQRNMRKRLWLRIHRGLRKS